jgi:hypothetical protein
MLIFKSTNSDRLMFKNKLLSSPSHAKCRLKTKKIAISKSLLVLRDSINSIKWIDEILIS